MIQRVQTIYIALAVIFTAIFSFTTIATISSNEVIYLLSTGSVTNLKNPEIPSQINTYFFSLICGFVTGLLLTTIASYKKRVLQMRITIVSVILNLGIMVFAYFLALSIATKINGTISYSITAIFPLISVVFLVLAYISIKKDNDLIKSLNRIR